MAAKLIGTHGDFAFRDPRGILSIESSGNLNDPTTAETWWHIGCNILDNLNPDDRRTYYWWQPYVTHGKTVDQIMEYITEAVDNGMIDNTLYPEENIIIPMFCFLMSYASECGDI